MRMLVLIITLLAATPATGQGYWDAPPIKDRPPIINPITGKEIPPAKERDTRHPFGHEIVFDNLVCAGYHQGLAGWHKREGDVAKSAIHQQLAEDFAANIIAIESFTGTQKSARAWTVANYLREKMQEAVNSKEWLQTYNAAFGPFCKRFEEGVTEYRKQ